MRFPLLPLALPLALAGTALGQTPTNLFDIYSGCTNFTSRGILGQNAGEYLLQVRGAHFSGIGHDPSGAGTRLVGFQYVTQDQVGATPETYHLVVRTDSSGAPDCTTAGLIARVGPLTTPASTVSTPVAWQITATLATVATTLPLCGTYYIGAEFPAAAGWANDGQSLHITDYALGDNVGSGAPNLSWNCINGAAQQPTFFETIRVGMLVESAVLHMGNVDPTLTTTCLTGLGNRSFGAGGMFPACNGAIGPRNDGLDCRVRDQANPNGVFVLFLGTNVGCPGLPISGLANGALYLNPGGAFLQVATGALDATGIGTATAVPPNTPACAAVVNRFVDFQSLSLSANFTLPGNLSNRAAVNYRP